MVGKAGTKMNTMNEKLASGAAKASRIMRNYMAKFMGLPENGVNPRFAKRIRDTKIYFTAPPEPEVAKRYAEKLVNDDILGFAARGNPEPHGLVVMRKGSPFAVDDPANVMAHELGHIAQLKHKSPVIGWRKAWDKTPFLRRLDLEKANRKNKDAVGLSRDAEPYAEAHRAMFMDWMRADPERQKRLQLVTKLLKHWERSGAVRGAKSFSTDTFSFPKKAALAETPYAGLLNKLHAISITDVPTGVDTNTHGTKVLIDDDIPPEMPVNTGKLVDVLRTFAHKASKERRLLDLGVDEERADRKARRYENKLLKSEQDLTSSEVKSFKHRIRKPLTEITGTDKVAGLITSVPKGALSSVERNGLMSSVALSKNPEALAAAFPDPEFRANWLKRLVDEAVKPHRKGPNFFFSLPHSGIKLPDRHPLNKPNEKLLLDLKRLLSRHPKTKFQGLELEPIEKLDEQLLKDGVKWEDLTWPQKEMYRSRRYREIDPDELAELSARSPEDLWKHYSGTPGMYAPNVPHVAVMTPSGIVEPDLLSKVSHMKTSGLINKLKKVKDIPGQQLIQFDPAPELIDKLKKVKYDFDTNPFPRGKWRAKDEPKKRTRRLTLADESLKKITGLDNNYGD